MFEYLNTAIEGIHYVSTEGHKGSDPNHLHNESESHLFWHLCAELKPQCLIYATIYQDFLYDHCYRKIYKKRFYLYAKMSADTLLSR